MGIIKRFRKWLGKLITGADEKITEIIGLPKIVRTKPIISARKALLEERHELFLEDIPMWERRMNKAIEEHKEEGMSEEELIERYGEENL